MALKNKRKNFKPKLCRLKHSAKISSTTPKNGETTVGEAEPEEKRLKIDVENVAGSPESSESSPEGDTDETGSLKNFNFPGFPSSATDPRGSPALGSNTPAENPEDSSGGRKSAASVGKNGSGSLSPGSVASEKSTAKSPVNPYLAMTQANPSLEHYIVRFVGTECGFIQCQIANSREHFHCKQCDWKLFTKKEEMLRHYKWHRKREESLAHGFMRYSASDSCSQFFNGCIHNLRQTHYHCLQNGCDKVYISTSDVQMHANSHRKAAHIAREGFQRFKASEDCHYPDCPFGSHPHRTTHFHCLRPGCSHSFKNKADMDKHKAHHMKDEQLIRDGFKKYMKSETCLFPACAFSRIVNHIHCIRAGCDYVLHSTSQMYSHKRKHEKQEKRTNAELSGALAGPLGLGTPAAPRDTLLTQAALAAMASNLLQQSATQGFLPFAAAIDAAGSLVVPKKAKAPASTPVEGESKPKVAENISSQQQCQSQSKSNSSSNWKKSAAVVTSSEGFKIKIKQYDPDKKNFVHTSTIYSKQQQGEAGGGTGGSGGSPGPGDDGQAGIDFRMLQEPLNLLRDHLKITSDFFSRLRGDVRGRRHRRLKVFMSGLGYAPFSYHNLNLTSIAKATDPRIFPDWTKI